MIRRSSLRRVSSQHSDPVAAALHLLKLSRSPDHGFSFFALTQLVIPAALVDSESTHEMLVPGGRLFEQRKATLEALDKIDGVDYVTNHAAFYLFPRLDKSKFDFEDAHDFAMKFLHEQHVLVIPGGGFDWHEDLRFRIVMLPEPETLTKAMGDMAYFLKQHRI